MIHNDSCRTNKHNHMFKQQLKEIVNQLQFSEYYEKDQSFNFELISQGTIEKFHLLLSGDKINLIDGSNLNAIGLLKARETTLGTLYDMGLDLIDSILDLSFGKLDNDFKLPEVKDKISLSTHLEGEPITFNLFIDDEKINLIETKDADGDIKISIKESYLSKLLKGNFNLPMALLTGKIKIENKAALFKLLAGLGLKF